MLNRFTELGCPLVTACGLRSSKATARACDSPEASAGVDRIPLQPERHRPEQTTLYALTQPA